MSKIKSFFELRLALIRDKDIPDFLVRAIDWIRYEILR